MGCRNPSPSSFSLSLQSVEVDSFPLACTLCHNGLSHQGSQSSWTNWKPSNSEPRYSFSFNKPMVSGVTLSWNRTISIRSILFLSQVFFSKLPLQKPPLSTLQLGLLGQESFSSVVQPWVSCLGSFKLPLTTLVYETLIHWSRNIKVEGLAEKRKVSVKRGMD